MPPWSDFVLGRRSLDGTESGETASTRSAEGEGPGEYGTHARTGAGGMTNGPWTGASAGRAALPARGRAAAAAQYSCGRGSGGLAGPVGGRPSCHRRRSCASMPYSPRSAPLGERGLLLPAPPSGAGRRPLEPPRLVDHVDELLPGREPPRVLDRDRDPPDVEVRPAVGRVRGQDRVRRLPERVVGRQRLDLVDVEPG